ncbi:MAG: SPOR domain-containing protein [Spirochaetaceae bacterium]|nr:SPOR domain-containing protein [Spirochaetaceae bacterium]
MNNFVKKTLFAMFFILVTFGVYARGTGDPSVSVTTSGPDSRLVRINWTAGENTQGYSYGLYRANKAQRGYSLVQEITRNTEPVLDSNLEPPLTNYYYFTGHVARGQSLQPSKELHIDDAAFAAQMATIPTEIATPVAKPSVQNVRLNNEGIYLGLVLFDNKIRSEPTLIPLDPTGRQELLERLSVSYVPSVANGTALYYAEHTALAYLTKLESAKALPSNLESVNIITFTDGLDTSSTDVSFKPLDTNNFAGGQTAAYKNYISQQMKTKKIGGKKVDAWAIGIQGRDITNSADFNQTLDAVSSAQDNIVFLNNVAQIEYQLLDLSEKLQIFTPRNRLTWTAPAYSVGTTVRLTFDNAGYADNSWRYIEGRVVYGNNEYSISNLRAEGVSLANSGAIIGRRVDAGIEYTLTLDGEVDTNAVMQWYKLNSLAGDDWIMNSEFRVSRLSDFTSNRKSAIIYLVLDCSSSLTNAEIDRIRNAIVMFIDKLYNSADNLSSNSIVNRGAAHSAPQALPKTVPQAPPFDLLPQPAPQVHAPYQGAPSQPYTQVQPQYVPPTQYVQPPQYIQPPQQYIQPPQQYIQPPQQYVQPPQQYVQPPPFVAQQQPPVATQRAAARLYLPQKTVNWTSPYSGFWVQAGAYTDLRFAQNLWRKLFANGCADAEIFGKEINGIMYYRVKIGPYQFREEAEASLRVLKASGLGFDDSYSVQQ